MRILTAFLVTTTVACATFGQEDPVETRRIPVGFLTRLPEDTFGIPLGLGQNVIDQSFSGDRDAGILAPDALVELLKTSVSPTAWTTPESSLKVEDGHLIATARRSVLDEVSRWLEYVRRHHERRIVMDAAWVVVPPTRFGQVSPRDLLAGAKILKTARISAVSGQRVLAQDVDQRSYVRDFDVQISTAASALDPVVDVLETGVRIDLRPRLSPGGNRVVFEVRSEAAALEALEDKAIKLVRLDPATAPANGAAGAVVQTPWEGHLQLPRISLDQIRGQVAANSGETVVAAAASRADGIVALLLTPTVVLADPALPQEAVPETRLYEVDALSAKIPDWPGPRIELLSPARGGGGPIIGAHFTLDEPREGYAVEALKEELREALLPGSPKAPDSILQSAGGSILIARGSPELHAGLARRLEEAYRREVRTVTTEAVVFAFQPAARVEWAKTVSALAPGGSRATDEEMARILAAAGKGPELRLGAYLSVSGRMGERVHVFSGRQESYIMDYEPQVTTASMVYDPIMGILMTGTGLDARPVPRAGDGTTLLRLRAWTVAGELQDRKVSTDATPVQCPKLSGSVWESEVVCAPGHWTLVSLESKGTGGDTQELALFVRVR